MKHPRFISRILCLASILGTMAARAALPLDALEILGPDPTAPVQANAFRVNDRGDVAGFAAQGFFLFFRPVVWRGGSGGISPTPFASTNDAAILVADITDNGWAAGTLSSRTLANPGAFLGALVAVRWEFDAALPSPASVAVLAPLYDATVSVPPLNHQAWAINRVGEAVGFSAVFDASGTVNLGTRGVRWAAPPFTAGVALGHLGTNPSQVTQSQALDINDSGLVVGYATKFDAEGNSLGDAAVRWQPGSTVAEELPGLSALPTYTFSRARAVNRQGLIGGFSWVQPFQGTNQGAPPSGPRPVLWVPGNLVPQELPVLGSNATPYRDGEVRDIDSTGNAVGSSLDQRLAANQRRATFWPAASRVPMDLNDLIDPDSPWVLIGAHGISDSGYVVGQAAKRAGQFNDVYAYRLKLPPELLGGTAKPRLSWIENGARLLVEGPGGRPFSIQRVLRLAGLPVAWATEHSGVLDPDGTARWQIDRGLDEAYYRAVVE